MVMSKVFFISEQAIKDNSIIETNVDSKIISSAIQEVQNLELQPILGNTLFYAIASGITSASTDSSYTLPDDYLTLLNDYIQPFLIYGVLVYAFVPLTYKVTNKGVNKKNDENATTASQQDLEYIKSDYKGKFDTYKERLINYLAGDTAENITDVDTDNLDSTADSTGWYMPDYSYDLEEYFTALANKTGFYPGNCNGYFWRG